MKISETTFVHAPLNTMEQIKNLTVCICIDTSESTSNFFTNNLKYLDVEKNIALSLKSFLVKEPFLITWNHNSNVIADINLAYSDGMTEPSCIIKNEKTCEIVQKSEVFIILTDGEINVSQVNIFGKCMREHAFHLKSVIGIIIGRRTPIISDFDLSIQTIKQPSEINVSVLFPAMITDGCILFHNAKNTYIMWSSGSFQSELNPQDITNNIGWDSITTISCENILNVKIPVIDKKTHETFKSQGYVHFGNGLFFSPEKLLVSEPSWEELSTYPFNLICQYFRVGEKYHELFNWFKCQKERFLNEFSLENHEKENINDIIDYMINSNNNNNNNTNQLVPVSNEQDRINSYVNIRNISLLRIYCDDDELNNLVSDVKLKKLLHFFRVMIQIMREDSESENNDDSFSAYTSISISKSRYVSLLLHSNAQKYTSITAKFNNPLLWIKQFGQLYSNHNSAQHKCSICYENDIPLILLREKIDSNNLDDVFNNYTKYFYPQILCSKCAEFFCVKREDPVHVKCCAAIPFVNLIDSSKIFFEISINELFDHDSYIYKIDAKTIIDTIVQASIIHFNNNPKMLLVLNAFNKNF